MSTTGQQIMRKVLQKWASRGYLESKVVEEIAEDIKGEVLRPFPELKRIAADTRAVDLGMRCYMHGHEERLARIKQIAEEAQAWADGAMLDPAQILYILNGQE